MPWEGAQLGVHNVSPRTKHVDEMFGTSDKMTTEVTRDYTKAPLESDDVIAFYRAVFLYDAIVTFLVAAFAVLGNLLTLVSVMKYQHLRQKRYILVTSLAVTDMLAGLVSVWWLYRPLYMMNCGNIFVVMTTRIVDVIPASISVFHLIVMGTDRYIAINYPLHYETMVTVNRIIISTVACWVAPILFTSLNLAWYGYNPNVCQDGGPVIPPEFYLGLQTFAYILEACFLLFVYLQILKVARRQAKIIAGNMQPAPASNDPVRTAQKTIRHKGTKMVMLVLLAYMISWGPYFVVHWLILSGVDNDSIDVLSRMTRHFGVLNSCVNVVIYSFVNKDFRQAYQSLLCCRSVAVDTWMERTRDNTSTNQ